MTKIQTQIGTIIILDPDNSIIKRLRELLPFGVLPLKQPFNGAKFGIVMDCGGKELMCLKLQPLEVERKNAEQLFQIQHFMIIEAYCKLLKEGFSGAYLASPYLRQRENGLYEAGVANFIFPATTSKAHSDNSAYDSKFGNGATDMFTRFMECFKKSFKENNLTIPQYFGIDYRTRSHLQNLAMYFMIVDSNILCLRAKLREKEDVAWTLLASNGIKNFYHFPAVPIAIEESALDEAKGLI